MLDRWRFCPICGEAIAPSTPLAAPTPLEARALPVPPSEPTGRHGGISPPTPADGRAECSACGFVAYANAAPTACALVNDDSGRLLLARRAIEPYRGRWDIPGGFLEEGEHPLDAVRRELREETGLEIEPKEFFGAWLDRYGDEPDAQWTLNLFWRADVVGGDEAPADDVSELCWFAREELPPPPELAFTTVVDVLRAWQEDA
jgi:ADP-ribose pyrophosphatase YjhB (NUDIX family)